MCLLGWSFGGVVGYEMARQFEQHGIEVCWLGLIDSHVGMPVPSAQLGREAICAFALGMGFDGSDLAQIEAESLSSTGEALQRLLARGQAQGLLPSSYTMAELSERIQITEANFHRMQAYQPAGWQGKASYYRAAAESRSEADNPIWKWMQLLSGMEVFSLGADHFSIVKGKHAQSIARFVQKALAKEVTA